MVKFLIRFLFLLLTIIVITIGYLNFFGLETDKFDNLIKDKANKTNQYVKLNFNKTKIHLNISELNLLLKLQNPKILVKKKEIDLHKLELILSLKSLYSSDFLLKRINLSFKENKINDLTKVTDIFIPKFLNNQISRILSKGIIEGEIIIPFTKEGKIHSNFDFNGKIRDANLNISKDFQIKNLTTQVKYEGRKEKEINITIEKGSVLNLKLEKSLIDIKILKDKKIIKSKILTKGKTDYLVIKKISPLLGLNLDYIKNIEFNSNLETNFDLLLSKKFKIINSNFTTKGKISNLNLEHKKIENLNNFLPSYESKISLKDTEINLEGVGKDLKLSGLIKFKNDYNNFSLNLSDKNKNLIVVGNIDLSDLPLSISKLNYKQKKNKNAKLNFNVLKNLKGYKIKKIFYIEENNRLEIDGIELNNNLEIKKIQSAKIKTFSNEIKNNDFFIKKHGSKKNTIIITGEVFDANPILKVLNESSDKKTFSKDFNSDLIVNFEKILSAKNHDLSDFSMVAKIDKGSYKKMNLKGNFSQNEIFEMTLNTINQNNKSLQVISDRASPFVKNYKFIKGFEGGKLFYDATITKKSTNSNLKISNFKVSKVPALAQLLTLADLRGISDTLRGDGITFDTFEMKFNSKGNLMKIEEAYASGPAVSIMLDGYIEKSKLVSLRGTLVPARTLNSIISKIPGLGKILIGEKVGEGIFGVSFKMKGPPKDIKTTVNPIKTLTPRFIVRAVERAKRKKQKKTK